jgi:nucleotide-binding universal stress UspA family protein
MTAPTILVVLDTAESAPACLRAAADAAHALGRPPDIRPAVTVLRIRIDPASSLSMPDVLTTRYEQAIDARSAAEGGALRAAYDTWAATAPPVDASWTDIEAAPAAAVRERAGAAALLVLARPSAATHPAAAASFDAALFDTGKPVLVVPPMIPPGAGAPFGRHLAVGWRDGPTTRRALEAMRPWLLAAGKVSVLTVADTDAALPADWAAANLPQAATFRTVRPAGRSDGAALLAEAAAIGADGLAIGAFRHGRLIERLLGGVTAEALRAATMPVLMKV